MSSNGNGHDSTSRLQDALDAERLAYPAGSGEHPLDTFDTVTDEMLVALRRATEEDIAWRERHSRN